MPDVKADALQCAQCKHVWLQRGDERPLLCPKCKSLRWDREAPAKNKRKKAKAASK